MDRDTQGVQAPDQRDGEPATIQSQRGGGPRMVPGHQFRAQFATMIDWVRDTGRPIVLTRYGEPIVEVAPLPSTQAPETLMGFGGSAPVIPRGFDIKTQDLFDEWEDDLLATWDEQTGPTVARPRQ